MIIKNNETDTGYFRLLDYSNQLAVCYSIDDIENRIDNKPLTHPVENKAYQRYYTVVEPYYREYRKGYLTPLARRFIRWQYEIGIP